MKKFDRIAFLCLSFWLAALPAAAQSAHTTPDTYLHVASPEKTQIEGWPVRSSFSGWGSSDSTGGQAEATREYPNPKSVLFKSLMIPGWGQLVNKQAWKIPLVYGLLAGVAGYSIYLTNQYQDYRAAYYNLTHDDMKFGPTPGYIPESAGQDAVRNTRNRLRNRRDFTYIAFVMAYGLNALDAYVYAHMRTFDVSDDLGVSAQLHPVMMAPSAPGVTLSVSLFNR